MDSLHISVRLCSWFMYAGDSLIIGHNKSCHVSPRSVHYVILWEQLYVTHIYYKWKIIDFHTRS